MARDEDLFTTIKELAEEDESITAITCCVGKTLSQAPRPTPTAPYHRLQPLTAPCTPVSLQLLATPCNPLASHCTPCTTPSLTPSRAGYPRRSSTSRRSAARSRARPQACSTSSPTPPSMSPTTAPRSRPRSRPTRRGRSAPRHSSACASSHTCSWVRRSPATAAQPPCNPRPRAAQMDVLVYRVAAKQLVFLRTSPNPDPNPDPSPNP